MKKLIRILFFGFTLMELYLLGQRMTMKKNVFSRLIVRWCKYKMNTQYGCYISFKSRISPDCNFIHPIGIVIGEGVTIGKNCHVYQCVTIGAARRGETKLQRYPMLGSGITVFAGAKIIGDISIGDNVVVGANSVVLKSFSKNSVIAGVPAKVIHSEKI